MVKLKKFLLVLLVLFFIIGFTGILSFYILVIKGESTYLQNLWVTTAMSTMNHQWLATSFIDQETIDNIIEGNKVDDTNLKTDLSLINPQKTTQVIKDTVTKQTIQTVETPDKTFKEDTSNSSITVDGQYFFNEIDSYIQSMDVLFKEEKEEEPENKDEEYLAEGYEKLEEGLFKKDVSGKGWKGHLLMVTDPSRVSLVQTRYQFERGDLIKTLVPLHNGIAGINAGGFVDGPNYDSNGGKPAGLLVINGEIIQSNGNMKHSVIGFNEDNILVLGKMTKQEVIDAKIRDAVEFSPFLIVNNELVDIRSGSGGIAPRTALGQRVTGEVVYLCINGRMPSSVGCDIRTLRDVLAAEKCVNAAMVDGGSSSVMFYRDHYINKPSLGRERYTNNCWLIK